MAPIPQVIKKKPTGRQTTTVSTDNVIDDFGRTLTYLQRRQKSLDQQQDKNTTVARQHAAQNESDTSKNTLIYRDVFPGRKYKLTLSDTTWIGGDGTLTIGYTVDDVFTPIEYEYDDGEFQFEIPGVPKVDTLEVRMTGVSTSIRGYMEDDSASSKLWDKIKELIQEILGLKDRIETLEGQISGINDSISNLDDRVSALEDKE